MMALVRARAWWTILRSGDSWGDMTRVGFDAPAAPAPAAPTPDRDAAAAATGTN